MPQSGIDIPQSPSVTAPFRQGGLCRRKGERYRKAAGIDRIVYDLVKTHWYFSTSYIWQYIVWWKEQRRGEFHLAFVLKNIANKNPICYNKIR